MSLENNKDIKINNAESDSNSSEKEETFEQIKKLAEEEISNDIDSFKKLNLKVDSIETSVSLEGNKTEEIEKDMLLREKLHELDEQAENLKKETEQQIEWVKLENHTFNEDNFYRVVDQKGFDDFQETGVVRSSVTGTDPKMVGRFNIGNRPTSFPSFDKGAPDLSYLRPEEDNYIFESSSPMYKRGEINPVTQKQIKGRHWAYRPIDITTGNVITELPKTLVKNIYKHDKLGDLYIKKHE